MSDEAIRFIGTPASTMIQLYFLAKTHGNDCIFLPFQIWDEGDLHLPEQIEFSWDAEMEKFIPPTSISPKEAMNMIRECSTDKRLSVIPLTLTAYSLSKKDTIKHANVLVYDKKDNTLERFEPHGGQSPQIFRTDVLDSRLPRMFELLLGVQNLTFLPPSGFCPREGVQTLQSKEKSIKKGFCAAWAFIYLNARLNHPDEDRSNIHDLVINKIKKKRMTLTDFILEYVQKVYDNRGNIGTT